MMRNLSILPLVFVCISCDLVGGAPEKTIKSQNMAMCYSMNSDITSESCVNDRCYLLHASIGVLANVDAQPCIQGVNASAPFVYVLKPVMPVCYPRSTEMIDGASKTKLYCKNFTKTSVFILGVPLENLPPPGSEGWFSCEERFFWCENTCGNGELEPWEQCDGENYPAMPRGCSDYENIWNWLVHFSNSGIIECDNNCQLDFSECFIEN